MPRTVSFEELGDSQGTGRAIGIGEVIFSTREMVRVQQGVQVRCSLLPTACTCLSRTLLHTQHIGDDNGGVHDAPPIDMDCLWMTDRTHSRNITPRRKTRSIPVGVGVGVSETSDV